MSRAHGVQDNFLDRFHIKTTGLPFLAEVLPSLLELQLHIPQWGHKQGAWAERPVRAIILTDPIASQGLQQTGRTHGRIPRSILTWKACPWVCWGLGVKVPKDQGVTFTLLCPRA